MVRHISMFEEMQMIIAHKKKILVSRSKNCNSLFHYVCRLNPSEGIQYWPVSVKFVFKVVYNLVVPSTRNSSTLLTKYIFELVISSRPNNIYLRLAVSLKKKRTVSNQFNGPVFKYETKWRLMNWSSSRCLIFCKINWLIFV